jgi:hypothetical protein
MSGSSDRADAPLVVFDFDHTLYDGDSGSHLFAWLIRRSPWRTALALLAAPVLGPMIAFLPSAGASGAVWGWRTGALPSRSRSLIHSSVQPWAESRSNSSSRNSATPPRVFWPPAARS